MWSMLIRVTKVALVATLAMVITMAVIMVKKQVNEKQRQVDQQIQQVKSESESKQLQEKDQYEKKIKELEVQLQAKLVEKARLAAETAKLNAPKTPIAQVLAQPAQASGGNYELVTKWANHYGIDPGWLHRVVKCESNYRSDAINGSYWSGGSTPTGIGQFLASTYIANAKRIGLPAQDDRLNPDRSLQVMAWMFSIGQWTQWECR